MLTEGLAAGLAAALPPTYQVEIGMRYGEPSIRSGLEKLREAGVGELVVVPLYPQFSHTTTSSIYDAVNAALSGDFTDMEEFVVQELLGLGAGSEAALLQLRFEAPEQRRFTVTLTLRDEISEEMGTAVGEIGD